MLRPYKTAPKLIFEYFWPDIAVSEHNWGKSQFNGQCVSYIRGFKGEVWSKYKLILEKLSRDNSFKNTPVWVEDDLRPVTIFLLWTKGEEKEDQLDRNYFYIFLLLNDFLLKLPGGGKENHLDRNDAWGESGDVQVFIDFWLIS